MAPMIPPLAPVVTLWKALPSAPPPVKAPMPPVDNVVRAMMSAAPCSAICCRAARSPICASSAANPGIFRSSASGFCSMSDFHCAAFDAPATAPSDAPKASAVGDRAARLPAKFVAQPPTGAAVPAASGASAPPMPRDAAIPAAPRRPAAATPPGIAAASIDGADCAAPIASA
jgi:hypothetical protein